MSTWTCPCCKLAVDSGDFPDHWSDGCERFQFECECGVLYEVDVDWSPYFHADPKSVTKGPRYTRNITGTIDAVVEPKIGDLVRYNENQQLVVAKPGDEGILGRIPPTARIKLDEGIVELPPEWPHKDY